MVDPYAIVRRLTGHELVSPKDAKLLTEAIDGLIEEVSTKGARLAELEAEVERLTKERDEARRFAGMGCDANDGGPHSIIQQGTYKFCKDCGSTIKNPSLTAEPATPEGEEIQRRLAIANREIDALPVALGGKSVPEDDDDTCTCCHGTGWYGSMERWCDCEDGLAQRSAAPEGQQKAVDWKRVDDALVSCAGLIRLLCRDEIGDTAAAELEYVLSVIARPAEQVVTEAMVVAARNAYREAHRPMRTMRHLTDDKKAMHAAIKAAMEAER